MDAVKNKPLSLAVVADEVGCPCWWLREQFLNGKLPEQPFVGRSRVIARSVVEKIRKLWQLREKLHLERAAVKSRRLERLARKG